MTNKQDIFTFVQVIGNIKKFNIKYFIRIYLLIQQIKKQRS